MGKRNCCGSDAPPPPRREWFKVSLSALWLVSQVWPGRIKLGSLRPPTPISSAQKCQTCPLISDFRIRGIMAVILRQIFSLIWGGFVYHWQDIANWDDFVFQNFASPILIKTCLFGLMQSGFFFLPFLKWRFQTTLKTSAAGEGGEYHILMDLRSYLNEKSFVGKTAANATNWLSHLQIALVAGCCNTFKMFAVLSGDCTLGAVCSRHGGSRRTGDWRINR